MPVAMSLNTSVFLVVLVGWLLVGGILGVLRLYIAKLSSAS